MTAELVTAAPSTPASEVARLMRDRRVGSVVLVDGGRPTGIVTDRDLTLGVLAAGAPADIPVGDLASSPVVTVSPEQEVHAVAELMVDHGIRRVPVDDGERLAGIVTLDDLIARTGDSDLAHDLAHRVTRASLPDFYFFDRGG
jgi:CBS domain-containing protein